MNTNNIIKDTVLEKLAGETTPQTDSFIQDVQADGVTYKREYIKDKVDRYIITQETSSEEKISWSVVGDYDCPEHYTERCQCEWHQELKWDPDKQSWEADPTKITVTNWLQYLNGTKENITSRNREGNIIMDTEQEKRFGILWNFYLTRGEKEFLECKKAGWSLEKMKERLELERKIAKIKEKQRHLKYDYSWQALTAAVKILAKNGQEGKGAARELIRRYRIDHQR